MSLDPIMNLNINPVNQANDPLWISSINSKLLKINCHGFWLKTTWALIKIRLWDEVWEISLTYYDLSKSIFVEGSNLEHGFDRSHEFIVMLACMVELSIKPRYG